MPLNSEGYSQTPGLGIGRLFTPGNYSFAATYSGDASFKTGTSQPVSFEVTQAQTNTSTSLVGCPTTGPCTLAPGTQLTIFGSVNSSTSPFSSQPTGTMTFYFNATPLSAPITIESGEIPPTVNFGTNPLSPGEYSLTVKYSGDTNYLGSTSPATEIYVGQTFAMTANPTAIDISSPGQSGSTTLTFAAQNGFTGSVSLTPSMCSNLPPKTTCSFNPSTVTFTSSTTTIPVTLTISTTGPTSSAKFFTPSRGAEEPSRAILQIETVCLMGICIVVSSAREGRRRRVGVAGLFTIAIIATAFGCGSGGGGGGGKITNPGTPTGTYTDVTVTVTVNNITQSVNNLSISVE